MRAAIYLAAVALLLAWDTAATHLSINVFGFAHEGNPLMVHAVAAGWWLVALYKALGFSVLATFAWKVRDTFFARFAIRFLFFGYAVLGYWHCYVLSL